MERVKRKLSTTILLEEELAEATEREGAEQLVTHALTMINHLADKNPQVTHQDVASGIIWKMELHFVHEFTEPILDVIMPFGQNVKKYFRPLSKHNWPAFVRHVKAASPNAIKSLQERIPEVKSVNFDRDLVKCPKSIADLAEPILLSCSQWGSFTQDFSTLSELLDDYYPTPTEVEAESAQTQPAETGNN